MDESSAERPRGMAAGLGIMPYNLIKVSSSTYGGAGFAGEYYAPLHVRGFVKIWPNWYFTPHAIYTPIPAESNDRNYKTSVFYVSAPFSYSYDTNKDMSFGIGYMGFSIHPRGGTATVTTDSNSAVYGLPSETKTIGTYYLEIGFSETQDKINGSIDFLLTNIFSRERSISMLITLNYHFLEGSKK